MDLESDLEELDETPGVYIIILFTCFSVGLASNIYIISFILRKNVKSVVQTYFLMHSVTITFELIVIFIIVMAYRYHILFEYQSLILFALTITLELIALLFLFVMCIIWFFAINNHSFKGHFKIILIMIFSIVLTYYTTIVFHCIYSYCYNEAYMNMFLYLFLLLLTLAMHIIKYVFDFQKRRRIYGNDFILITVTMYIISWLPTWVLCVLYVFNLKIYNPTEYLLAVTVGCLYSFFNLIAFIIFYKHWRIRIVNFFKCNSNSYTRTEDSFTDSVDNYNASEVTAI